MSVSAMVRTIAAAILMSPLASCMAGPATLNAVPVDFARRVERGWLPGICLRQGNPDTPGPITRHWARPRAGGKVRVLFICSSRYQYEAWSLARSFDFDCDIVPIWPRYAWRENDRDPDTMNLLRHYLGTRRYDAIAMAGGWLSILPDDCEEKISELIRAEGVGFIYAMAGIFPRVPSMQGKSSPILDPLIPIVLDTSGYKSPTGGVMAAGDHPLSGGSDFGLMEWGCDVDATAAPGATVLLRSRKGGRVLAAAISRSAGRVVAYNRCYGERTYAYPFLPAPLSPPANGKSIEAEQGKRCRWLRGIEPADQFLGWLGRAILWTANEQPIVTLEGIERAGATVSVEASNSTDTQRVCLLRGIVRAPYNAREKVFERTWTLGPQETSRLSLDLPDTGYLGPHMLDVFLLDEKGDVWDWGSTSFDVTGRFSVAYKADHRLHDPKDDVKLTLWITSGEKTPCTVRTELFDLDRRLLFDQSRHLTVGGDKPTEAGIVIPLGETLISSRLANVRITVRAGGEAFEVRDQLLVSQGPRWGTVHIMAYMGFAGYEHPSKDVMLNVLKEMGHDTLLCAWPTEARLRLTTESGCRVVTTNVGRAGRVNPQAIQWMRKFSPVLHEMQDEPELQVTPVAEARQGHLERFRQWLKGKYHTLEALNAAWGTSYKQWENVERLLWYEVIDSDNWGPWFDSRRELDYRFTESFGQGRDVIGREDPAVLVSINPRSLCTFGGFDLRGMTRRLGAMSMYCDFVAGGPLGYLHLGSRWADVTQSCIGYSWPSNPAAKRITREAWDAVRHGVNNICWFIPQLDETPPKGRFGFLDPDLTPNAKGRAIAAVNRQLLSGPGQVAAATQPLDEGIFIYYPRTLFYTNTLAHMKRQLAGDPTLDPVKMRGLGPWADQLPSSFVPHLRVLGYQFDFGDEADLTPERLKKTRAVLLSNVECLGRRELRLLKEFADSGGCILAEAGTARRDDSGRVYAETPSEFAEMFGLKRARPNRSPIVDKEKLVPCGAEAVKWVSPLLGPAYRKGNVFFVNFRLPVSYRASVAVGRMLESAGVRPTYPLRDNFIARDGSKPIASLVVRRRGDLSYLFLTGDGNLQDTEFHIDLPSQQHVYEMVSGEDLGLCGRIDGRIEYGQAKVFALSRSPVRNFTAAADRKRYRRGEPASVSFALETLTGRPGDRVVLLEYRGPTGGKSPQLPRTLLLPGGLGKLTMKIPLNSASGIAELRAKDLTTGAECGTSFEILPLTGRIGRGQ